MISKIPWKIFRWPWKKKKIGHSFVYYYVRSSANLPVLVQPAPILSHSAKNSTASSTANNPSNLFQGMWKILGIPEILNPQYLIYQIEFFGIFIKFANWVFHSNGRKTSTVFSKLHCEKDFTCVNITILPPAVFKISMSLSTMKFEITSCLLQCYVSWEAFQLRLREEYSLLS